MTHPPVSAAEEEVADGLRQPRHDVVERHDNHEQDQQIEADLQDSLLDLDRKILANDALEGDDHEVPPVEDRNRQEVEDAEL